ncbi:hypothetical protein Ahy_B03g065587 [Arachis hypogaea]|uniref:Protein FAR1-RELATED SEQUENCE n=1 Tax=Arachis hypogaea TaxID=3818 RepID=A0A445A1Y3_ARAHY|nr:hypothetical protein Ahy_B03g065587 [Arachis hypogaea]
MVWFGQLNNRVFWEKAVCHTFTVEFDPLSQKVRCECNKFESTGILCCHTLSVWSYYRVDTVSSCYVLLRWSKNFILKHTYIKSSHDVAQTDKSHNLFRHLCSEFYNVAQEFVACDEKVAILQFALRNAKSKLSDYRGSIRSTTFAATQNSHYKKKVKTVIFYGNYSGYNRHYYQKWRPQKTPKFWAPFWLLRQFSENRRNNQWIIRRRKGHLRSKQQRAKIKDSKLNEFANSISHGHQAKVDNNKNKLYLSSKLHSCNLLSIPEAVTTHLNNSFLNQIAPRHFQKFLPNPKIFFRIKIGTRSEKTLALPQPQIT